MTGTCKYCGQTMMVETESQGLADMTATEECKCQEGREYRNIEAMKKEAKDNIDALTEDVNESAVEMMYKAVEAIAEGSCKRVGIKVNERVSMSIAAGKDCINVSRKYSESNTLTAEKL